MKENLAITAYCIIRNNSVVTGSGTTFSHEGSLKEFCEAAYRHIEMGYPKFHKMDNLCRLGMLATEMILRDRNAVKIYKPDRIACILTNSSSSLDTDLKHQKTIASRDEYFPSPAVFVYTLPNVVIGEICIRHKIFGEGSFFVTGEPDPDFIASYCSNLFSGNVADCCIAGMIEVFEEIYEAALFLVERRGPDDKGIAIFSPESLKSILYR